MAKYVYIVDGVAREIMQEFTEDFPNIPFEKRYSEKFVKQCVKVEDDVEVVEGFDYNSETGEFTEHIEEIIIEEPQNVEEVEDNEGEEIKDN